MRYVGSSNFSGWQIAEADHVAAEGGYPRFVSAQNHWSLLERDVEREVVPAAEHYGIGVLPYFPLANGLLTGKVRRGEAPPAGSRLSETRAAGYVTEAKLDVVERLEAWAHEHDRSLLEVAVAGLLAFPATGSVIAGATSAEQVRANATAGAWELTDDEVVDLEQILAV